MNRPIILLIIPIFLFCFAGHSNPSAYSNVAIYCSPGYLATPRQNINDGVVWQSKLGNAFLSFSAQSQCRPHFFNNEYVEDVEDRDHVKSSGSDVKKKIRFRRGLDLFCVSLGKKLCEIKQEKLDKERKQALKDWNEHHKERLKLQESFVDCSDKVQEYACSLIEEARTSDNKSLYGDRLQARANAIRKAIDDGFRISYIQYKLSAQASRLLKQHNIDSELFKGCIGNAIQQQSHAEFVNVLNDGADLYSKKAGLPGATHLVNENWFRTLGNISSVGIRVNTLGRYRLVHTLSDISYGIYAIGKKAAYVRYEHAQHEQIGIESLWGASVDCVKKALKSAGDAVVDFTDGVQQKAFGRPARLIAEFAHLLENNPNLVFEKASGILFETTRCTFESTQLLEALINDSRSERTTLLLDEFEKNWAGPLREKVITAAKIFWEMPLKEKAQEVVALGVQVLAVVGAVKLIAALAAQAAAQVELLEASVLLKLDQLSQTVGPVMQTGVGPDGTVSVALQAVEQMSEELVAVAQEAIVLGANAGLVASAAVDTVSTMALVVRDAGSGMTGGGTGARSVKKIKLIPPEELRYRYKRLKPKSPKVEGSFDRKKLEGIDYPKRLKFTQRVAKHIFEGNAKVIKTISGKKSTLSGFHSDYKGQTTKQSSVKIKTTARHPKTGVFEGGVIVHGDQVDKTMFSSHLTPEEVWDMGVESVDNVVEIVPQGNRFLYQTVSKNGTKIVIVSEANGEVVTFFPKSFTKNFGLK